MNDVSPYLRRSLRSLEGYRDTLVVELGQVPVTCGRARMLATLIRKVDAEIEARKPSVTDDTVSCDCCGETVSRDDIGCIIAYGVETYACGSCRE